MSLKSIEISLFGPIESVIQRFSSTGDGDLYTHYIRLEPSVSNDPELVVLIVYQHDQAGTYLTLEVSD